jgi:hypothetical protein
MPPHVPSSLPTVAAGDEAHREAVRSGNPGGPLQLATAIGFVVGQAQQAGMVALRIRLKGFGNENSDLWQ